MTITENLKVSAYLGSARLERQIWRQIRLWLAVLILASTVAAGSVGLTDRLLNYVAGKYGQEAKLRLLEWQEIIKSHQKSDKQEKSYSTGEAGGLEKIVNRSKRFGNTPAN